MRRSAVLVSSLLVLVSCQDSHPPTVPEGGADPGIPGISPNGGPTTPAGDNRYIVVFREGIEDVPGLAASLAEQAGGRLGFVYQHALSGFAAAFPSAEAALGLRHHPRVAYVEADQIVHAVGEVQTGVARTFADANPALDIDGVDDWRVDVDVALIDTGVDPAHPQLDVFARTDCVDTSFAGLLIRARCQDGAGPDENGHGTFVAGVVGAFDDGTGVVGMAPGARLWSVRVLDASGSGYMTWIVAGVDYVTAHAGEIEVANMSLGCECDSQALTDAITGSVAQGVIYAAAAGNGGTDASTFNPAKHPDVITVSALADFDGLPGGLADPTCTEDQDDTLAGFSNYGSAVEIAAPGVCITSTYLDGGYGTGSGTSAASPHVAGAAAILASTGAPTSRSEALAIRDAIVNAGNFDWTDDSGDGIHEPLLDLSDESLFQPALIAGTQPDGGGGEPDPSNTAPVADDVTATGDEDTSIEWTPSVSDDDGDALACSIASGPASGTASVASDCTSGSYTPDPDFNGSDSFSYRVSDGRGGSDTGIVQVTVNPMPDAPTAADDAYSTGINVTLQVDPPGVLSNDSDADGDPLTASLVSGPSNGIVSFSADGGFSYTPAADYQGEDSFVYEASDGTSTSQATVIITVADEPNIHVGDLDDLGSTKSKGEWTGRVRIVVHDENHQPLEGVWVSGFFRDGTYEDAETCQGTDAAGVCVLQSDPVKMKVSELTLTIEALNFGPSPWYFGEHDHDVDGDTDGRHITVRKP